MTDPAPMSAGQILAAVDDAEKYAAHYTQPAFELDPTSVLQLAHRTVQLAGILRELLRRLEPGPPERTQLPTGTPVTVLEDDGTTTQTVTRSPPWQVANGRWVVLVEGRTGGWSLDRITPVGFAELDAAHRRAAFALVQRELQAANVQTLSMRERNPLHKDGPPIMVVMRHLENGLIESGEGATIAAALDMLVGDPLDAGKIAARSMQLRQRDATAPARRTL